MTPLPTVTALLLAASVVTAAVYDIRYRRIPNWVCVVTATLALAANVALNGLSGAGMSLAGLGLAMLIYFPLYLLRAMGAGDVKLMAAVGAVVGPGIWLVIFLFSVVIGAILGLSFLIARGGMGRVFRNIIRILNELAHLRPPHARQQELDVRSPTAVTMPHGAAVALGSLLYLLLTGPLATISI